MKNKNIILIIICIILVFLIGMIILLIINNDNKLNIIEAYKVDATEDNNYLFKDYNDYKNYISNHKLTKKLDKLDFNNNSYVLVNVEYDSCGEVILKPNNIEYTKDKIIVTIPYRSKCGSCAPLYSGYLIKVDKQSTNKKVVNTYQVTNHPYCDENSVMPVAKKPIIYLYPEETTNVNIKMLNEKDLLTTYPKYKNGWNVTVDKNGKITYQNKEYYALYYESNIKNISMHKDGFVVSGKDVSNFLEEKLELLGLNYKEREEFIVYWLPILEKNKYNYIYFETNLDELIPMSIEPKPNTEIRILMEYKPLNNKIKVPEQKLSKVTRSGFTLVEWGGTLIDSNN